jgi:hypothetical protein
MEDIELPTKKDKTTYMREYKREQYKKNPEQIKEKNKAYYYKYKYNISVEEAHKYDTMLPNIVRLRKEIEDIIDKRPELINDLLTPYLNQHSIPTI